MSNSEKLKIDVMLVLVGTFCGVVCYADDLCLMAPNRSSMEMMLKMCEEFATENNLQFSTDPDPAKSKSMCTLESTLQYSGG